MFPPIRAGGGRHRLRRVLRPGRRGLATGLAIAAAALAAAAPQGAGREAGRTEPVLVAARDLPAGARLDRGDLTTERLPSDRVPAGAVRDAAGVRGRTLAGPVRRGEPLTDWRLLGPALLAGYAAGDRGHLVAVPVRIADPGAVRLLRPGDRIDVLAGPGDGSLLPAGGHEGSEGNTADQAEGMVGTARVVAPAARVVTIPSMADRGGGEGMDGALVVLAVPRPVAAELAGAAATSRLTVTFS